jgi:hypothetical protein
MASINVNNLPAKAAAAITALDNVMTFTASGDTTQTPFNEAVAQAQVMNGCLCVLTATVNIPTAEVLTLNSSPVFFSLAVPTGYYIKPIGIDFWMDYNSIPYATNTSILVSGVGMTALTGVNTLLASTTDTVVPILEATGVGNTLRFTEAVDIYVSVGGGDPTAGNSDISIVMSFVYLPAPF